MKLERLQLENFRQYYGKQRIELAKDPNKKVTVIHGVNGAGKTSLFLAINWCFYGDACEGHAVIQNVGELVSKEAVAHATDSGPITTSVEVTFHHEGEKYIIKRTRLCATADNGSARTVMPLGPDELNMIRVRADGQSERVANPHGTINAILPVNVREYFLFDGEKIDNFAKPEAADQVREAIYLVVRLALLDRARRHLESLAADYRKDLKKVSSGELKTLLEEVETKRAQRANAGNRLDELDREIASARQKIRDIDDRLRQIENVRALQERRDRTDRDLKQRSSELEAVLLETRDLVSTAYQVIPESTCLRALQVLDDARKTGQIPSSIREQFVRDLIANMKCICGRPIAEDSKEHRELQALIRKSVPSALEDDVLETAAALRRFEQRASELTWQVKGVVARRAKLITVIEQLQAELDDVARQLKGSPLEDVASLEKQRERFQADIESSQMEIGVQQSRTALLTKDIQELEHEIEKARKDQKRERLLGEKLRLAQEAADTIVEVYRAFAEDVRARIERETREIFQLLVWKDTQFQDVVLGSDFCLDVIDRWGSPARPELSAGERQVLSLSFITAMARVSGEEAPLVMDTPFGRLSSAHRSRITEHLPQLADQLVLFVTDEELRDEARKNLEPYIGAEYRLQFNQDTGSTAIEEVAR